MQFNRFYPLVGILLAPLFVRAQDSLQLARIKSIQQLNPVVVTAQIGEQTLKNSVYKVRHISAERIKASGATQIQQVLNTMLGFRFSQDLALGTADVELMGMNGRNLKILVDGVPMVDRSDTRESLNQIDIQSIESIEVVEGPVSVVYGSDALAGVINIITKKPMQNTFLVGVLVQEESAGKEYQAIRGLGIHQKNVFVSWSKHKWGVRAGLNHYDFGGWNAVKESTTLAEVNAQTNRWKPKTQWMPNAIVSFNSKNLKLNYRADILQEDILNRTGLNPNNYKAEHQYFKTSRLSQQIQAEWKVSSRFFINNTLSYASLNRKTESWIKDYVSGDESLSMAPGKQDLAKFNAFMWRATGVYSISTNWSMLAGLDWTMDAASGARISDSPSIQDAALFITSEWKPTKFLQLRPGFRFTRNNTYKAPVLIPSLNAKFNISTAIDVRLAYAQGFRAPALHELYFDFVDASHSILGNPNLKAETSSSYNGTFTWRYRGNINANYQTIVSGFYNDFNNRIDYSIDPNNPSITTLFNISKFKTTGFTLEQHWVHYPFQASLGFSSIGRFNRFSEEPDVKALPTFVWSKELNAVFSWNLKQIASSFHVFYKYLGARPAYQLKTLSNEYTPILTQIGSANWLDFTFNKTLKHNFDVQIGVKNALNVTSLSNSGQQSGSAHGGGQGQVPYSYGRSIFLGVNFKFQKSNNHSNN